MLIWQAVELSSAAEGIPTDTILCRLKYHSQEIFVPWIGVYGMEIFNVLPGYLLIKTPKEKSIPYDKYFTGVFVPCLESDVSAIKTLYDVALQKNSIKLMCRVRNPIQYEGLKVLCLARDRDCFCMASILESQTRIFLGKAEDFAILNNF